MSTASHATYFVSNALITRRALSSSARASHLSLPIRKQKRAKKLNQETDQVIQTGHAWPASILQPSNTPEDADANHPQRQSTSNQGDSSGFKSPLPSKKKRRSNTETSQSLWRSRYDNGKHAELGVGIGLGFDPFQPLPHTSTKKPHTASKPHISPISSKNGSSPFTERDVV